MSKKFTNRKKRKAKKILRTIAIIFGVISGLVGLAFVLLFVVVNDNNTACKELGLKGSLFGCVVDEDYTFSNITIISGNTANSPAPNITENVKPYIINSLENNKKTEIDAYSVDSRREKLSIETDNSIGDDEIIEDKKKNYEKYIQSINEAISVPAKSSGADYLGAIMKFGKSAKSRASKKDGSVLLVVIGSGLSDSGMLDFAHDGILSKDIDVLINDWLDDERISGNELDGVSIVWTRAGETTKPQAELSESEITQVKDIYRAVLEAMGARLLEFDDTLESESSVETKLEVKTVKPKVWGEHKYAEDSVISFTPGEVTFKDENKALEELRPLAEEMNSRKRETVEILGYMAKFPCDAKEDTEGLGKGRAETVKNALVKMGVSEDRIIAKSGGFDVNGTSCPGGFFDDNAAKKNRIVKITPKY